MTVKNVTDTEFPLIVKWNQQLQEDEGATVMTFAAIEARFRKFFEEEYQAVIFEDPQPVGYALYRPTYTESEGPGYYLRQFFIDRDQRRKGYGRSAFNCLRETIFANHRIILEVLETNPGGYYFWQAVGMTPYSHKLEINQPWN